MKIDKALLSEMLSCASDLIIEQKKYLDLLDAKYGDGDHGVTMEKIAGAIKSELGAWTNASISDFLSDLGDKIMTIGGGASSVLWGAWIGGLSHPITNEETLDAVMLKKMLASALEELSGTTKARVGDKTMMDAIIPATQAAQAAPDDIALILEAAAGAAKQGAISTESLVCGYGRAKYYGDKTIGTPDPGAVSAGLFFEGFARAL